MSSQNFLDNANNCAAMAREAKAEPDRKRFTRMEASWRQLAKANDWLEGRITPVAAEEKRNEASQT